MCIKKVLLFMNILPCKALNIIHQYIFLDNQILGWRRENIVLLTNKINLFKYKILKTNQITKTELKTDLKTDNIKKSI